MQATADGEHQGAADDQKKKLVEALKYLRNNDEEWLRDVVGDSLDELIADVDHSVLLEETPSLNGPEKASSTHEEIDEEPVIENENDYNDNMDSLRSLGYDDDDIRQLKSQVVDIILDKQVRRPKKGLPISWLNMKRERARRSFDDEDIPDSDTDFEEMKMSRQTADKVPPKMFKWQGRPLTEAEKKIKIKPSKSPDDNYESDLEENEPVSFWPDLDEFKDMLIDESKFRVNMAGFWTTPFVKAETKWRYKLYKGWMDFLNQGVGSAFDEEEPESFEDDDEDTSRTYVESAPPRKATRTRTTASSRSEESPEDARAREYDSMIRKELALKGVWSNLRDDEIEAKKLLRRPSKTVNNSKKTFSRNEWFEEKEDSESPVIATERSDFREARESGARRPIARPPPSRTRPPSPPPKQAKKTTNETFEESDEY